MTPPVFRARRIVQAFVASQGKFSLLGAIAAEIEDAVREDRTGRERKYPIANQVRFGVGVCEECGKEFPIRRRDARFCHTNCSVKWHGKSANKRMVFEKKVK